MRFSAIKKHRKKHRVLGSLLLKNPVLVMGLDLPFIIAASVSLRSGLAISLELLIVHMVTMAAGCITCRMLPLWQRIMVNAAVSTLTMLAARYLVLFLFPGVLGTLGMYLYLVAINGMTLLQAGSISKRARPQQVIYSAFLNGLAFTLVAVLVALLREIVGAGTIWGVPLPVPFKLGGILLPFGGFMVMAFLLAATKFFNKKLLYLSMREIARKEVQYTRIRVVSEELL